MPIPLSEAEVESLSKELWIAFFPLQDPSAIVPMMAHIKHLYCFFNASPDGKTLIAQSTAERWCTQTNLDGGSGSNSYYIYFKARELADVILYAGLSGTAFEDYLHMHPMEVLGCLGIALSLIAYMQTRVPYDTGRVLTAVRVRFVDLSPIHCYSFTDLKANAVGRLVSIRGHVIRVSAARPLILSGTV